MEKSHLVPISEKDCRKVVKGCRVKYKNEVPRKELKAMLGYCPNPEVPTGIKVDISDETGFRQVFSNMKEAEETCGISNGSAIKYAIVKDRPFIKRRSDKKIFYMRAV